MAAIDTSSRYNLNRTFRIPVTFACEIARVMACLQVEA
jgi:hypothetical protein